MAGTKEGRRFRVWPGIVAPLGLTLLLGVAAWLFQAKVAADQERADAEAYRLEGYARLEAGELAAAARDSAAAFVEARLAARRNQEKNLRLETRGVLDSVYRLLTVGLEKIGRNSVARREVGPFPPGFDGVRSFLAITPQGEQADAAVAALRASTPELSTLLPAGCSLAVIEDNSRELLSIGGGAPVEGSIASALTREFLFNDGNGGRHWSLRVEMTAPDAHPLPGPKETAEHLSAKFGDTALQGVAWRGWLLGPGGGMAAVFPVPPEGGTARSSASAEDPPPYIDKPGEWTDVDGRRLVWLERSARKDGLDWVTAVAVSIPRPAPPLDLAAEFWGDSRWSLTLGALALFSLAGWLWFFAALFSRRGAVDEPVARSETRAARTRLVRDARAERSIPEVQGVIVADIGDDGSVRIEGAPAAPPAKPRVMPSGSLVRLQAIHRGREGGRGSRVLDQAKSQVLRELAGRVRPTVAPSSAKNEYSAQAQAHAAAKAKAVEKIAAMKSATGWRKVED